MHKTLQQRIEIGLEIEISARKVNKISITMPLYLRTYRRYYKLYYYYYYYYYYL